MAPPNKWNADDIPSLDGKIAVVTGANSGLGYYTTRELARHGAHTIMACRSLERAEDAREQLLAELDDASIEVMELDLANLESIRAFAEAFEREHEALDLLVNNAGIMAIPRRETEDGFEMQIGVNHLGHFALTGHLLDALRESEGTARVVNVSSGAHQAGDIRFDDLHWRETYSKWGAYAQSKLANLLFTYELDRRLRAADDDIIATAAHPGYAATNLQMAGPEMEGSAIKRKFMEFANNLVAQSAEMGALPTLYAASARHVEGGDYIGPDGFMEMKGYPTRVESNKKSQDRERARRLWELSERETSVEFDLPTPSRAAA
jgi:hypothetical protein